MRFRQVFFFRNKACTSRAALICKKKKKKRLSLSIICEGKPMSLFCISLIVTISAVKMPNFRSHSGNAQVRNLMEVLTNI